MSWKRPRSAKAASSAALNSLRVVTRWPRPPSTLAMSAKRQSPSAAHCDSFWKARIISQLWLLSRMTIGSSPRRRGGGDSPPRVGGREEGRGAPPRGGGGPPPPPPPWGGPPPPQKGGGARPPPPR